MTIGSPCKRKAKDPKFNEKKKKKKKRKKEKYVSWCFEPRQPQRTTSRLGESFVKR